MLDYLSKRIEHLCHEEISVWARLLLHEGKGMGPFKSISYSSLLMLLLPCARGQLDLVLSNRIVAQIKQTTSYLGEFLHNSGVY